MKRVFMIMVCLLSLVSASTGLNAQEISILLCPGWNWIGYPYPETVDLGTAFGDFEPLAGDVIESSFGYSEYISGYGWYGGVNELRPGWGYMYYSNRTESVTIVFSHPSTPVGSVTVTTSEPMLITAVSAMGGGEVTTTDGTYIIVKGLCWAAHENPTTNDDFYEEAESGIGTFSISMTELNMATTYYVRAYAVTSNGTVYGNQKTFTTRDGIPTLTTTEITNLTCESATSGGNISDNGGLDVTARGVCWSTTPNPTINDSHTDNGTGIGDFTSSITNLNVSTTYYVRAYATNSVGTSYGNEVSLTTPCGIPEVVTNPVTDIYGDGATMGCTVVGYGGFVVDWENGWCRIGVCWSTSPNPTTNDYKAYIYNWDEYGWGYQPISNDFSAYRTGLSLSTTYYVRAYAQTRFGTSYGNEVSFTTPAPLWSNGVLPGEFSVSEGQQVRFSQGNLQYRASTDTWRFALNQWSFVGGAHISEICSPLMINGNVYTESGNKCNNDQISSTYSGWIDLFGWSTSGNNHGAACYQPWSTSETYSDYFAYGSSTNNLYDQTGLADWGYNPISNGGDLPNQWHTLAKDEWKYLFNTRSTESGIRYAKATVFGSKGVILLPDDWDPSYFSLSNTNSSSASFSSNTITAAQWSILEQHGAVFLCETGIRHRYIYYVTDYCDVGDYYYEEEEYGFDPGGVYYWSSSYNSNSRAYHVNIKDSGVYPQDYSSRHNGMAVRLVCFTTQDGGPTVTTNEVSDITYRQATCGGTVTDDGGLTITARGVCWSTSHNPTLSDSHTTDGTGTGSFSSSLTGLSASTTYYVRAYASNRLVTIYGGEQSFTTEAVGGSGGDHEYVDLGLPSGLLWAACNVGAEVPEDYGDYFAWGETQPKDIYNWSTYQYYDGSNLTKYTGSDGLTTLLPEDDAATANWGSDWRMPTKEEWDELYQNTTHTVTIQNGVNGELFTASNGNSLFLPAAGYRWDGELYYAGSDGRYWSSSLSTDYPYRAWYLLFGSGGTEVNSYYGRYNGFSVRPVLEN